MEDEIANLPKTDHIGFLKGLEFYHKYINKIDSSTISTIKESLILNDESSSYNNSQDDTTVKLHEAIFEISHSQEIYFPSSKEYIDLSKDNSELKRLNEVLEREVNLLKSLILINNLNLKSHDTLSKRNYFVDMCNEDNVREIIQNDKLYQKQETLHTLIIKINVFIK
jgi:hypothetical protein